MAKFCTNCGSAVEDGASFCENCGTRLSAASPAPPASSNQRGFGGHTGPGPQTGEYGRQNEAAQSKQEPHSQGEQDPKPISGAYAMSSQAGGQGSYGQGSYGQGSHSQGTYGQGAYGQAPSYPYGQQQPYAPAVHQGQPMPPMPPNAYGLPAAAPKKKTGLVAGIIIGVMVLLGLVIAGILIAKNAGQKSGSVEAVNGSWTFQTSEETVRVDGGGSEAAKLFEGMLDGGMLIALEQNGKGTVVLENINDFEMKASFRGGKLSIDHDEKSGEENASVVMNGTLSENGLSFSGTYSVNIRAQGSDISFEGNWTAVKAGGSGGGLGDAASSAASAALQSGGYGTEQNSASGATSGAASSQTNADAGVELSDVVGYWEGEARYLQMDVSALSEETVTDEFREAALRLLDGNFFSSFEAFEDKSWRLTLEFAQDDLIIDSQDLDPNWDGNTALEIDPMGDFVLYYEEPYEQDSGGGSIVLYLYFEEDESGGCSQILGTLYLTVYFAEEEYLDLTAEVTLGDYYPT